jgi:lincosamide nucleotidyltransferase A/C/D/E
MKEKEAIRLNRLLMDKDIQTWVVRGWGIDALYGKQTRSHKDLDLIMQVDDIDNACQILNDAGYSIKTLFSENRSDRDYFGNTIDTSFILMNSQEKNVDLHAIVFDSSGNESLPGTNRMNSNSQNMDLRIVE